MSSMLRFLAAFLIALGAAPVWANDHGGGGSAAEPYRFVVNLARSGRVLQTEMVFDSHHPETAEALKVIRPKVQHTVIILLSSETPESVQTLAGKEELAKRIRDAVNKLIKEDEKTGVAEVLFTSFVAQ